ncbi:MAG: alpha/beta hydrolase [bacterium]|nr:alpha/beta hydrolase [bacterium]
MLMSDRSYYPVRPAVLNEYNVLTIDMRGHGDSLLYKNKKTGWRRAKGNIYWGSFNDIRMGIKEIKLRFGSSVDTSKIFLQGSSYSCVLILQYFLKYPDNIKGLIFMSPGNSYGQQITAVYKKMLYRKKQIPVFHVCSGKDFYCYAKTKRMEGFFRRRCKVSKSALKKDFLKTRFSFETEHVHGTHFFYSHPWKYPETIIQWMKSLSE